MKTRVGDLEIGDLVEAQGVAIDFVSAIARREEAAARELCYGPSLELWDLSAGVVGLWRRGTTGPFFARLGHSMTARVIEGADQPLVCFGFVVTTEAEEGLGPTVMAGPRPAIAVALFETPDGWKIWGQPHPSEFAAATLIDIPLDATRRGEAPPSPPV